MNTTQPTPGQTGPKHPDRNSLSLLAGLAIGVCLAFSALSASARTDDAAERSKRYTLQSTALEETRELIVRTPPGFTPGRRYPVVYVTDGEWNFELVAGYLDYLVDNGVYPPLIITAVTNVNRNRDFVPRADKYFEDTGQAGRFLEFVEKDWIPFIDKTYSTSEHRVLVGHSFGGVFTLHALFSGKQLFDAYLALGSSAWIAERVLFEEAEAWFKGHPTADEFVYMAVGEGDGGPTVPSSEALAALFEDKAPTSLEWTFSITPRTDHFKNVVSGMHDGFMELFPAWGYAAELELAAKGGSEGVDRWFTDKRNTLGWRFQPAWFELGVLAATLTRQGEATVGVEIMRHLRDYHPDNAHVAAFSAGVYEASGKPEAAAREYRRAIQLAEAKDLHPNAIHLDRLRRGLKRVTDAAG